MFRCAPTQRMQRCPSPLYAIKRTLALVLLHSPNKWKHLFIIVFSVRVCIVRVLFYIAAEAAGGFYTYSSTHSCRYKCTHCYEMHKLPLDFATSHREAKRIRNMGDATGDRERESAGQSASNTLQCIWSTKFCASVVYVASTVEQC